MKSAANVASRYARARARIKAEIFLPPRLRVSQGARDNIARAILLSHNYDSRSRMRKRPRQSHVSLPFESNSSAQRD